MQNFVSQIKEDISKGRSELAVEALKNYLEKHQSKKLLNDAIVTSSNLKRVSDEFRHQRMSYPEYNLEIVKINYSLLDIVDKCYVIPNENITNEFDRIDWALERFELLLSKNNNFVKKDELNAQEGKILIFDKSQVGDAIEYNRKKTITWAKFISFKDLLKDKETGKTYVDLAYSLTPRRLALKPIEEKNLVYLDKIFDTCDSHLVILGQPGAGKTTTMKQLVRCIVQKQAYLSQFEDVLVIRLREINDKIIKKGIIEELYDLLGIQVDEKEIFYKKYTLFRRLLLNLIDDLKVLLIFDGFDELQKESKKVLIEDLREMSLGLVKSKFILTSRAGDYNVSISNTTEYEISPLSEVQIKKFISNWLGDENKTESLWKQIRDSPFADTVMRPLTLAHLCALYERYNSIPEKPKTVYRKVVNLLLEEWDIQRSVIRKSSYSSFEVDRKFEFLSNLAYHLTINYNKSSFSKSEIKASYNKICYNFNLPIEEDQTVLSELETHTGIFLQAAYDRFEFAHKSIQEYLAAEYLVKLPVIPLYSALSNIPSELALAVAISSNPTTYLCTLIFDRLFGIKNKSFFMPFFDRLIMEKPDFHAHPMLGVSFLALFTSCYYRFTDNTKLHEYLIKVSKVKAFQKAISNLYSNFEVVRAHNLDATELRTLQRIYLLSPNDIAKLFMVNHNNGIFILKQSAQTPVQHDAIIILPNYVLVAQDMIKTWDSQSIKKRNL